MGKFLLAVLSLLVIGCDRDFEPPLTGWKAYTRPIQHRIHLVIDGQERILVLDGDDKIGYRFAQWTKSQPHILLVQSLKTETCANYQLISIDTTGAVVDTIYTAPANTPINFKLAPNDSLLLLKTYNDNCVDETDDFRYTFYNRFLKKALPDTIWVPDAWNIRLPETVWSPDSRKVILYARSGRFAKGFTYDLATKDTANIGTGINFTWSPSDKNLVAYINGYSIYSRNMETGDVSVLFEGKKKRSAYDFRFNPTGEFLMIHIKSYILNIEARPLTRTTIIYYSLKDNTESRVFLDAQRIDTWIDPPSWK